MKTSRAILWIILLIILVAAISAFVKRAPSEQSETLMPTVSTSTDGSASSSEDIPGSNLTLGSDMDPTLGTYLTAYNGMTLYTYAPDTTNVSNCTGSCAEAWPPYIVTRANNLVAESPIGGTVGTITREDGSLQVTYNGHPLYFFAHDNAPRDTKGQGIGGVWFIVKP